MASGCCAPVDDNADLLKKVILFHCVTTHTRTRCSGRRSSRRSPALPPISARGVHHRAAHPALRQALASVDDRLPLPAEND
jgi:hypothetical protein